MTIEPDANRCEQDKSSLGGLRRASLLSIVFGAVASLTLMLLTRQNPPALILWLFVVWVAGPYAGYLIGHRLARRWPTAVRRSLYISTIVVAMIANLVYLKDVLWPPTSTPAFIWVFVPPVMGGVVVVVVIVAASFARLRARS